jgi:serine/threonine protein phosphatase PrpC
VTRPVDADATVLPPVLGRPSPSSAQPGRLRRDATVTTAAYRAEGGDTGTWAVRAVSIAGVRHRLGGEAGQDAFAWRVSADGTVVVVAVADGVGGVPGSGAAALAAVEAACAAVDVDDPAGAGDRPGAALGDAVAAADAAVRRVGGATTLVVAALGADGRGRAVRVGDSTALGLADGAWRELWPHEAADDGPLVTATAALPADAPSAHVTEVDVAPGAALVLVTDGVDNPRRDGPTTVAPALAAGLAAPPTPLALGVLVDFSRQGCFDDRTLLGLWRHAAPDGSEDPPRHT